MPPTDPVEAPWRSGGRRRGPAVLLVAVDGSASSARQLAWALLETRHRAAVVLAVLVIDAAADTSARTAGRTLVEAEVRHAVAQTGGHGRVGAVLLDPLVYQALVASACDGDIVVVRPHREPVSRPPVPRTRP